MWLLAKVAGILRRSELFGREKPAIGVEKIYPRASKAATVLSMSCGLVSLDAEEKRDGLASALGSRKWRPRLATTHWCRYSWSWWFI